MASAPSDDDRLPWLDSPPAAVRKASAGRRVRTPLLVLLGLFMASAVAVMANLAGHGSAPVPPAAETLPAKASPPTPAPIAVPALVAPVPPAIAPTPPAAAATSSAGTTPRAERPAIQRSIARHTAKPRGAARPTHGSTVHRSRPARRAIEHGYSWPVLSATAPSGRVVQLGAYYTGRQTMAAWLRVRRAYPFLATLPRRVTVIAPVPGRPRYYRLRIGAHSPQHARALCHNLHRIGRGCIVV